MSRFKGYRVLITGASSGIGESIARVLAGEGVHLVLVARRKDRLEALAKEFKSKHGVETECIAADLSQPEMAKKVFETATSSGKTIQILINNAGIGPYGDFLKADLESHLNTLKLNTQSLTELCYLFSTHMLEQKTPCYILNVSSVASFQGSTKFAVYAATKSYVRIFSEILGAELSESNVSVSCLCPGGTYTEFLDKNGQNLKERGRTFMMTSERVAQAAVLGMFAKERVIVPGVFNKVACFLPRFLPRHLALRIASRTMQSAVSEKN